MKKETNNLLIETAERIVIDYANFSGRESANRTEFREVVDKHLKALLQSFIEAEIERLEEKVRYIDDYRSGKNEQDFRGGWSGFESGECCDKCRMEEKHFTGIADALKAIVGCRNPFQLKDVCECHIPFRKVAAKVERKTLQDHISHLKELLKR